MLPPASEEKLSLKNLFSSTTAADKILFSVLILLSLSGIIFMREALSRSETVRIEVDGQPEYLLPLDKNRVVPVKGPKGTTCVEIKDHKVRVTESPCHNKLCMQQGWVSNGAIVCLPNRVVVIVGNHGKHHKTADAITG